MRKITKYDVANGRFAEQLYQSIVELAASAKGGVVALSTPRFTKDPKAMPHIRTALVELARRLGAEEWRNNRGVAYIVPVERLRRLTLRDVEEAVKAARRAMAVEARKRAEDPRGGDTHSCGAPREKNFSAVGGRMPTVSIHLPKVWLAQLRRLVKEGYFASVSEAVRVALWLMLSMYRSAEDDRSTV